MQQLLTASAEAVSPASNLEKGPSMLAGRPVKIVLRRRPRPGAQAAFDAWVERLLATTVGEVEGSSVLRAGEETLVLLRFSSEPALSRWRSSTAVTSLFAAADEHSSAAGEQPVIRSGLETWFTLPGAPPLPAPPRWKMALVTWCALLPQVIVLGFLIPGDLPFPLPAMLGTAIPVATLTWVLMPQLTRILHGWLFAASPHRTEVQT